MSRVLMALCAMAFVAAGCTDDGPDEVPQNSPTTSGVPPVAPGASDAAVLQADRDVPVSPAAAWTVLVYINGRNDLDGRAAAALDQLAQLQPTPGSVNVVALAGRTGVSGRSGGGLQPFNSVKLLGVDGSGSLAELADFGAVPMGQPGALREFLANGIELFPSQRLAMIVVGPGAGWQGISTDTTGASVDQLSIPELADEISRGLSDRRHAPLDVVVLDGSLMAGYEVASALAGSASVLVATEGPAAGPIVDLVGLRAIAGTDALDGRQLGRALIAPPVTVSESLAPSIIDLDRFGTLRANVEQWGAAVARLVERQGELFLRAAFEPAPLAWSPAAGGDSGALDLVELTAALAEVSPDLDALGANVVAELRSVVDRPVDDPLDVTGGLSIYVPVRSAVDSSYGSVESAGGWRAVVDALGRLGASAPSFPVDALLSASAAPAPYKFSASLTADSVSRAGAASVAIGLVAPASGSTSATAPSGGTTSAAAASTVATTTVATSTTIAGSASAARAPIAFSVTVPATIDAAGAVRAQWDGQRLLAVSGSKQESVWLDVSAVRDGAVMVPFMARRGGDTFPVVARARFESGSTTTGAVQYFRIGARGDWSPLLDLATVTFTPVLRVEQASGPPSWTEAGEPLVVGSGIGFTLSSIGAQASFGVRLTVGGRADGAVVLTTVVNPTAGDVGGSAAADAAASAVANSPTTSSAVR